MNKADYLGSCHGLMKRRGFFPSSSSIKFFRNHGGIDTVVLDYLHTPAGMLSASDEKLALINHIARKDVINKSVKTAAELGSSAAWYAKCVKYWANHTDIIKLFKD